MYDSIEDEDYLPCGSVLYYSLRFNLSWCIQATVYIALTAYLMQTTYVQLQDENGWYVIARCFGAVLKLAVPSVFIPLCRVSYRFLGKYTKLGIDHWNVDHMLFGIITGVCGLIHTVAHYRVNSTIKTWSQGTGVALVTLFVLGAIRLPVRYAINKKIHQVFGILFGLVYLVHAPSILSFSSIFVFFILVDLTMDQFFWKHKGTLYEFQHKGEYITLVLMKPKELGIRPGEYLFLSTPNEPPHPFTPIFWDETRVAFLIKRMNGWTQRLSPTIKEYTISGAYGKDLFSYVRKGELTLMGAGVGQTPVLSLLYYLNTPEGRSKWKHVKLTVYIIQRYRKEFIVVDGAKKHAPYRIRYIYHCSQNMDQVGVECRSGPISLIGIGKTIHVCGGKAFCKEIASKGKQIGVRVFSDSF